VKAFVYETSASRWLDGHRAPDACDAISELQSSQWRSLYRDLRWAVAAARRRLRRRRRRSPLCRCPVAKSLPIGSVVVTIVRWRSVTTLVFAQKAATAAEAAKAEKARAEAKQAEAQKAESDTAAQKAASEKAAAEKVAAKAKDDAEAKAKAAEKAAEDEAAAKALQAGSQRESRRKAAKAAQEAESAALKAEEEKDEEEEEEAALEAAAGTSAGPVKKKKKRKKLATASPTTTTCGGAGLSRALVLQPTEFFVDLRNPDGVPLRSKPAWIRSFIAWQDDETCRVVEASCDVEDIGSGRYSVEFQAPQSGSIDIHVFVLVTERAPDVTQAAIDAIGPSEAASAESGTLPGVPDESLAEATKQQPLRRSKTDLAEMVRHAHARADSQNTHTRARARTITTRTHAHTHTHTGDA
jgi:hypothetical protein